MNRWINEKHLVIWMIKCRVFGQTVLRQYQIEIKNMGPVTVVLLITSLWPWTSYIFLSLRFLSCNILTNSLSDWDNR